jgi:homeobox protein cut-like
LRKQFEIISDLRGDIKNLQQDNLKLYEKVRYMQSYRDETAASSSTYVPGPANAIPTRPDEMTKYKSMYEERMNPFEAFRGKVRRSQRNRLISLVHIVYLHV